jgi:two-component system LytT family response regulator
LIKIIIFIAANHPKNMSPRFIKTIVIDDEKPSREALATYIRDYCSGVEIVAECDSVKSAFQAIQKFQPQLVFLDIEMPNGNGFDLLQLFKTPSFKVIFVTAFSDYAIRAFRFSAIDYLLKPVKVDELVEAVDKVKSELASASDNQNLIALMDSLNSGTNNHSKLVIPCNKGFSVIKISDVVMCQADGYVTHFYLLGKTKVCSTKILKHYEEIFDHQLIRVHRSYIVNLEHVKGYTHHNEILLADNLICPLGETYKQKFLEMLGKRV